MEGFDVKATIDTIVAYASQNYLLIISVLCGVVLLSKGTVNAIKVAAVKALTDNWQLTLLASTGIALSVASAYTTFDGLRNFTSAPLLSVAIAFGIQGVMLIVAWLIGESFATGMATQGEGGRTIRRVDATVGAFLGLLLSGLVFYWLLHTTNAVRITQNAGLTTDWNRFVDVSVYFLIAVVAVALIVFGAMRGGDIATPYMQSMRLIVKNSVLWVMFLITMAASVFFSFDSHFNAIFPSESRKRAAEIRSTGQIGGVIADIGALTQKRQLEEAERLFDTEGWKAYDKHLTALAQASQGAQGEIEKFFVQQMEDRRRAIAQQQERISTAQSSQAGLANKKISLAEELARLRAERPGLAADYAQHQAELDAKNREIDAKRVEGLAEERGVEGTLKQGRGQIYRQRMIELTTLQEQGKIKQERTNDAKKRLATLESRLSQIERELSTIDGDLAKMKGEEATAAQRIKAAERTEADDEGVKLDPARVLPAFERARAGFRQQPNTEHLAALQQQCSNLLGAMTSAQVTKERVRAIDCDPHQAAEAAGRVFALNAGLAAFQTNCAGGDKIAKLTTTDALLGFGRRCLQDSGLVSADSADMGARMAAIDMNRDDKAHRFIVTWNAFLDGNRLAYLALILAIGVDSLVFMSGLFGAQALRSPLSDVPSVKARSAQQLESIIEAALLPDMFQKARAAREAMHPMAPMDGFTNVVHLRELDPDRAKAVRDVLNAGATIGAVRQTGEPGVYLVRAELYEFLCNVIRKEMKLRPEETRRELELNELETRIVEALLPNVRERANAVLNYMHPIEEKFGFTSEIRFEDVDEYDRRAVRNVLTAGISLRVAQRASGSDHFFLRPELFKTLARVRAREEVAAQHQQERGRLADYRGGPLREHTPALAPPRANRAIPPPLRSAPRKPAALVQVASGEALRETFQNELLRALRFSPATLAKLQDAEVARVALTAAQLLKRQTLFNATLRSQIEVIEVDGAAAIKREAEVLAEQHADDARALEALEEVKQEITQRLPALMLMPEGGLIELLIMALEEGAGEDRLNREEQALLGKLRDLKRAIEAMDLADLAAWRGIQKQIEQLRAVPSVAALQINGGSAQTKH